MMLKNMSSTLPSQPTGSKKVEIRKTCPLFLIPLSITHAIQQSIMKILANVYKFIGIESEYQAFEPIKAVILLPINFIAKVSV